MLQAGINPPKALLTDLWAESCSLPSQNWFTETQRTPQDGLRITGGIRLILNLFGASQVELKEIYNLLLE